jgi:MATE family multidrug resistance protein
MGAFGAGLSTLVARTLMPIAYVVFILSNKKYRRYTYFFKKENLKLYMQKNILRLGAPIAVQQTLECFSFSMVTIMMGWFSAVVLAAYQIVTTFFTMTFQISCGVASATTILVSHSYGRKDYNAISEHSKTGVTLSIIAVGFFGLLFILIPDFITSMFTDDVEVIKQAAPLFLIAGIFQVIDGTQVTLLGALRGMNDVNKPMKYSLFGYILIALPLAYILGFIFKLGPCGTFSGIAIGLLVAALLYKKRLQTIIKIKKNSIFAPQN